LFGLQCLKRKDKVKQKTVDKANLEEYGKHFMALALEEANKAAKKGEVPIGVVIVEDGKVIAKAHNTRNKKRSAILHAEIIAITKACKKKNDWRLENCDLFVTLMPCPMCAGAVVNARIGTVFYGADNENKELFEKILSSSSLNHKTHFVGGVLKDECSVILKNFFKDKRNKK
jgi:tRNA(adenine34) deaminase